MKIPSLNQESTGVDLWYYNGKYNLPAMVFSTGRHGQKNITNTPYIVYPKFDIQNSDIQKFDKP